MFLINIIKINKGTSTTGITENNVSPIQLYPNPTTGLVLIDCNEYEFINGFKVYDVTGKVIISNGQKISSQYSLDISKYGNGIYFFETEVNGQRFVSKLIKK